MASRPPRVDEAESIARFVFSEKNEYNPRTMKVRTGAFKPPPNLKMSVCRVSGLDFAARKSCGEAVAALSKRALKGAAITKCLAYRRVQLELLPSPPPPHHADAVGWPTNPDEIEQRAMRLKIAESLCAESELELYPSA